MRILCVYIQVYFLGTLNASEAARVFIILGSQQGTTIFKTYHPVVHRLRGSQTRVAIMGTRRVPRG